MQASAGALVSFTLIVGGIAELVKPPATAPADIMPPHLTDTWTGIDAGCSPNEIAPWTARETTKVSNDARAAALAVDDSGVYWALESDGHDSSIVRATSGTKRVLLASKQVQPTSIALDASSVYWISGREIRTVNKGGGAVRSAVLEATPISTFAVDGGGLYWIVDGLVKKRVGTGPESTLAVTPQANAMVVDDGAIYVASKHGILRVSKRTRETTVLVEGETFQIASDADNLFWADRGTLFRTSKDSGETVQVGPSSICTTVDGLSVDGERVFMTCGFAGGERIVMLPKVGGCPVSLRNKVQLPATIRANGGALFWSESAGEGVQRLVP